MTFLPGERVYVRDVGLGTVARVAGKRVIVALDRGSTYLATAERVERIPTTVPDGAA